MMRHSAIRSSISYHLGSALALAAIAAMPVAAHAKAEIAPYIELDQTVVADVKGNSGRDDILTYTTAAVGVDGSVTSRRAEAQVSLRYEHLFPWSSGYKDQDIVSGIARARYWAIPETLSLEATGFATRVRGDSFYGANTSLASSGGMGDDIYSISAGPSLTTSINNLDVTAAYRLSYTTIDNNDDVSAAGAPYRYGTFGDSIYHSLNGSVGMKTGQLPFAWTVSGGYDRENVDELKQRFSDLWGRLDLTIPVTQSVALVGGVGYEKLKISQQSVLVDGTGVPVVNDEGNYVGDPSVPRQIAYETSGMIWDAGVLWRPSRHTTLEARIGRRYGDMNYSGSFVWEPSASSTVQITFFDTIDSFGRGLSNSLSSLPFTFTTMRDPFTGDLSTCVSGQDGVQCLNGMLAGINGANYRSRGVTAQYSMSRGRLDWGVAVGWTKRKFLAPATGLFAAVNGVKDNYYFGTGFVGVTLDQESSLSGNVYANYMDSGVVSSNITNYGGYVTYQRRLGSRFLGQASIGLDSVDASDIEQVISLLGRVGVRYQF